MLKGDLLSLYCDIIFFFNLKLVLLIEDLEFKDVILKF